MGQDASKPSGGAGDNNPLPILKLDNEIAVPEAEPAATEQAGAPSAAGEPSSPNKPAAENPDGSLDQLPVMPPAVEGTGGVIIRNLGDYRLERQVLGEGAFGKVRLATSTRTAHRVAVKVIKRKKLNERAEVLLQREVKHHEKLRHPNIVRLHTFIMTPTKYYLVMEYCEGGDLLHHINGSGMLTDDLARTLFRGLLEGIQFCHHLGIHHRDLKLENLMLTSRDERQMQLQIADFGLSDLQILPSTLSSTFCGSPLYAAPELMTSGAAPDGYDASKSDVWSCGVILYALLCSALPFDADDICALVRLIQLGVPNSPVPEARGPLAAQLVTTMLTVDPKRRPNASEVLTHPWAKPQEKQSIKTSVTTMSLASVQQSAASDQPGSGGAAAPSSALPPSGGAGRRRGASATTNFFKEMMLREKSQPSGPSVTVPPTVTEEGEGSAPATEPVHSPSGGAPSAAHQGWPVDVADQNTSTTTTAAAPSPAQPNVIDVSLYPPNNPPPAVNQGSEQNSAERPKGRAMTRGELGALKEEAAREAEREAAAKAAAAERAASGAPAEEEAAASAPAQEEAPASPATAETEAELAAARARAESEEQRARSSGAPLTKEEWDEIRRERQAAREERERNASAG